MLKEPCPYHQGPVKHTLEECVMLRRYFHKTGSPAEDGKGHDNNNKPITFDRGVARERSSRRSTTAS
jgi:hypothetical protein